MFLWKNAFFRKDGISFRCSNESCGKKMLLQMDSWFGKSHLSLEKIIKLTYCGVYKYAGEARFVSFHTYNKGNGIILQGKPVGGPGKTVKINRSKFGKRKYHQGKRVEGV